MSTIKKTLLAAALGLSTSAALACTGFSIEAPDGTNVFAFNSENDIPSTMPPALVTIEAGTLIKSDYQDPGKALVFATKYDIVGIGTMGELNTGMNTEGLAGTVLNLWGTEYNEVNEGDTNVLYINDVHKYVLGNAKTIDEAEALLRKVKVGKSLWKPVKENLGVDIYPEFHIAYQDKLGNKAVFEWLDGELVVTRDADGTVANTMQKELIESRKDLEIDTTYKGQLDGLDGSFTSQSRYTKAYLYSREAEKQVTDEESAVRQAKKVSNALIIPTGIMTGLTEKPSSTYYHTVFNLDGGVMHYRTLNQDNWNAIDIAEVKFDGEQITQTK